MIWAFDSGCVRASPLLSGDMTPRVGISTAPDPFGIADPSGIAGPSEIVDHFRIADPSGIANPSRIADFFFFFNPPADG